MHDMGMPTDAECVRLIIQGEAKGKQWKNYSIETLGMNVDSIPQTCAWPWWQVSLAQGDRGSLLQLWFRRVRYEKVAATLEARWHPDRGEHIQMVGIDPSDANGANKVLSGGLKLLKLTDRRGREKGTPYYDIDKVVREVRAIMARGDKITIEAIAEKLGIHRDTFFRYQREYPALREALHPDEHKPS